jgi:hypothetical protein
MTTRARRDRRSLDDHVYELAERALERGATWDQIGEAIDTATREGGKIVGEHLRGELPKMIREHASDRRRFERNLRRRWGDALDLYYAVYVGCIEVAEEHSERQRPEAAAADDYRFEAIARLQARACVFASEIYALLRTGHAVGAEARARTLHEIAVTGYVLKDGTVDDAERYLHHADADNLRRALAFQPHATRLGFDPITDDEMEEMRAELEELKARFGPGFTAQYGWAEPIVGKSDPTFRDLERHVSLDHLRPYYQWFSDAVRGREGGGVEHRRAWAARRLSDGAEELRASRPCADGDDIAISDHYDIRARRALGRRSRVGARGRRPQEGSRGVVRRGEQEARGGRSSDRLGRPGRVAHRTRNLPRREISERSSILRDVAGDPSMVYALFLARTR